MKYLIAGLGNIGDEYVNTRHNMGFNVADALAVSFGVPFTTARYGAIAKAQYRGHSVVILKPSTYMNESGKAVRYWLQQEHIPIENLLVVLDDLALPLGAIRMKGQGSDGGHNGLRSIDSCLGTNGYARMRMGIGNDFPQGMQVNWVLGEFNSEEKAILLPALDTARDAAKCFISQGIAQAMNQYNKRGVGKAPDTAR